MGQLSRGRRPLRRTIPAALAVTLALALGAGARDARARARWTPEEAQAWQRRAGWLVGANYIPATAINQLEMWQAATWDPRTIERELKLAAGLGMNSLRVFLHDIVWQSEGGAYLRRIDHFLRLCAKHRIGVMLVLFDSVWNPDPRPGPQPAPRPGVHNSGWVQSPGSDVLRDPARLDALEGYVKGVIGYFARDPRVQVWDLVNEADNVNDGRFGDRELPAADKAAVAERLVRKVFAWARAVDPTQPLTVGLWQRKPFADERLTPLDRAILDEVDVVSFHEYGNLDSVRASVASLRRFGRPLLCTEYLARPGSTFDPVLGEFAREGIAAYNWGLVDGKTQTIYPWKSWEQPFTSEPVPWHHDIFRADGRPYDRAEVRYFRSITARHARRPR